MHKPRKRELSILLTAHCLDKLHIFMKFRPHIPSGSEVVALNNILPRTDSSTVKNHGLSLLFIMSLTKGKGDILFLVRILLALASA